MLSSTALETSLTLCLSHGFRNHCGSLQQLAHQQPIVVLSLRLPFPC